MCKLGTTTHSHTHTFTLTAKIQDACITLTVVLYIKTS